MWRGARCEALRVFCSAHGTGAPLCVFCVFLRLKALVLQPASRGAALSFLFCVFASFGREGRSFISAARVKS